MAESRSGSRPSHFLLGQKLPGPVDRLALEIVAEAEVAQHLEEGMVVGRAADVVDVAGPQTLLAGRRPGEIQLAAAEEVVLELVHPGGVNSTEGSQRGTSTSLGRRTQPLVSKKLRYFSRSSSAFIVRGPKTHRLPGRVGTGSIQTPHHIANSGGRKDVWRRCHSDGIGVVKAISVCLGGQSIQIHEQCLIVGKIEGLDFLTDAVPIKDLVRRIGILRM